MVRDETDAILDDLLSRWHAWCRSYAPGTRSADPMFRHALRARGEQTLEAIAEDTWLDGAMKAIDFQVSEMAEPGRTAIYVNARNCYTGRSVWLSPRLPQDPATRAVILLEARTELIRRLLRAGVM